MANVVREKEMNVPIGQLYKAITEVENYPKFLSEVVSAKKVSGTPEKFQVRFEIEVVKRFQYTLEFQSNGKDTITWKLVDSDFFKKNQGSWNLKSSSEKKTAVHYELDVDFGFLVPGFISKKLTEVSLPKMLDAFESRAKDLENGG
mgnify:CR=1 FL=1